MKITQNNFNKQQWRKLLLNYFISTDETNKQKKNKKSNFRNEIHVGSNVIFFVVSSSRKINVFLCYVFTEFHFITVFLLLFYQRTLLYDPYWCEKSIKGYLILNSNLCFMWIVSNNLCFFLFFHHWAFYFVLKINKQCNHNGCFEWKHTSRINFGFYIWCNTEWNLIY